MRASKYTLNILMALAATLSCMDASAQSATMPATGYSVGMPPSGPYEAKLDGLIAARDYDALIRAAFNEIADRDTAVRALDWMRAQQSAHGQGSFISFLYAASLWRLAATLPPNEAKPMKASAVTEFLLTRWLVRTEGFQCADMASPAARLSFAEGQLSEIARYFNQLPADERSNTQRDAEMLLILGFPKRLNDDWLCRSGPLYVAKYRAKHPGSPIGTPTDFGANGQHTVVPNDPEIPADFVPFEAWHDMREQEIRKLNMEIGAPTIPDVLIGKYHAVE